MGFFRILTKRDGLVDPTTCSQGVVMLADRPFQASITIKKPCGLNCGGSTI